jgi:hypothetical protein
MALIELKTNLKSLKFKGDLPGGGTSNQPYIKKDTEKKEKDKESKEDNKDVEDMGEAPGTELVSAIDKKKLLNMMIKK